MDISKETSSPANIYKPDGIQPPTISPANDQLNLPKMPIKKNNIVLLTIIIGILLIGIIIIILLLNSLVRMISSFKPPIISMPTPTAVVTPITPRGRVLSEIATQSAFMVITENMTTLWSNLENTVLTDPRIVAPILELPLGFSK